MMSVGSIVTVVRRDTDDVPSRRENDNLAFLLVFHCFGPNLIPVSPETLFIYKI